MNAQQLKNSILQMAVQGKLVPQDPNDEPASVLLEKIRAEKERLIKEGKIKKDKRASVIFRGADNAYYEKVGDSEPVCIDDQIPFEIPDSWEWVRLGSLLNKLCDGTHYTPRYHSKGVPFISVKDVSSGVLDFSNCKFISPEEHCELYSRCDPELGDILLTKVGTTGIPVIVDTSRQFSLFVSVALLKFNQHLLSNEYLVYLIQSPLVQKQAKENTRGVGNKNWVVRDIAKTLVTLPPFSEQRRIVDEFNRILPYIKKYNLSENKIKSLNDLFPNQLKKSILQEAVQGKLVPQDPNDEPASVLLERIRAEKERLIAEGKIKRDKHESRIFKRDNSHYEKIGEVERCIDDEIPFEIPDSWEWVRPRDLGIFGSGQTPKAEQLFMTGEIPYFKVSDMNTHGNEKYLSITSLFLATSYNGRTFKSGTIVFPKNGGAVFTNKKRILAQTSLVDLNTGTYTPLSSIHPEYIWLLFTMIDFRKYYKGTALPTIDFNLVDKIIWAVPPFSEQKRIVKKLQQILNCIDKM